MKQFVLSFLAIAFLAVNAIAGNGKPVNVSASKVNWKAYKVTGSHEGYVNVKSGSLEFNGDAFTGGKFVIDMTSINATDVSGKAKENLDGHLKSEDFFGVAKFPEAKLDITRVISKGKPGEYKVVANLTIKNTTKEIKFDAMVANGKATASIKLDRTDFDVRYGSGSFFDNLGDKTIYDEFDLTVSLAY
ncbi:MAG: YceI family protein [Saprospiraceae bacterium]|nr:YceI family protein [Saprospiraceae bacterium]